MSERALERPRQERAGQSVETLEVVVDARGARAGLPAGALGCERQRRRRADALGAHGHEHHPILKSKLHWRTSLSRDAQSITYHREREGGLFLVAAWTHLRKAPNRFTATVASVLGVLGGLAAAAAPLVVSSLAAPA